MIKIPFIIIITLLFSCKNKTENKTSVPFVKESTKQKNIIHTDTLIFIEYNDDTDYFLLMAKKNKHYFQFINDNDDGRSLLKGDIVEIKWKNDTIFNAGDNDNKELAERIVSSKKIKDGLVSTFRKQYKKPLKYNWSQEENYSKSYLDKLYLIVEYYVANCENELINLCISDDKQLEYSIEERTENGKKYTVIGIANVFEHKVNTIKWLYYDHDDLQKLYEYDLANDKLVEFE